MSSKLSLRLKEISSFVDKSYLSIWDLCCDHGKLGLHLYEQRKCASLHLVDCVESIIKNLKKYETDRISALCLDGALIENLQEDSLICICGVGGEELIKILIGLETRNDLKGIDFLISPHNQTYKVRKFLRENGYGLIKESVLIDGKWSYELLYVSKNSTAQICEIGKLAYLNSGKDHLAHLRKIIKHYSNVDSEVAKKYNELLIELT